MFVPMAFPIIAAFEFAHHAKLPEFVEFNGIRLAPLPCCQVAFVGGVVACFFVGVNGIKRFCYE